MFFQLSELDNIPQYTVKILHGTYAMSQWLGIVYGNKVGVFTETGKAQDISIHLYLIFSMNFL